MDLIIMFLAMFCFVGVIVILLTRNEALIRIVIAVGIALAVMGLLSGAKFITYIGVIIGCAIVLVVFLFLVQSILNDIVHCLIRRD